MGLDTTHDCFHGAYSAFSRWRNAVAEAAGYMVAPGARGKSVGRRMAEFSLEEAKRLGYCAMQFNIVVKSNENAVRLWQNLGFEIIGEIPEAFNHIENGLTNAYIMYRKL